jgi:nucleoside-diphosphate-sugar epimerase
MPAMGRCLVTGADGFIGTTLCTRLVQSGVQVVRMIRKQDGLDTLIVDLGRDSVPDLSELGPQTVFHLAARVHQSDDQFDADSEHMRVTVEGTRSLLAACAHAGVRVFVFFSTCAVMPAGLANPVDESAQPQPSTPYARAKLAAEDLVLRMNGIAGMRTVCLRLPMVYGRGGKGQLPRMVKAIERGWFPPIPDLGGGRSVVHVEDAVDAAILVANNPRSAGRVYVVAEPHAYTSRELYEIVLKALGRRPPRWRVPRPALGLAAVAGDLGEFLTRRPWPFDTDALTKLSQPAWYSAARIERELGFKTTRNFGDSAGELVDVPAR